MKIFSVSAIAIIFLSVGAQAEENAQKLKYDCHSRVMSFEDETASDLKFELNAGNPLLTNPANWQNGTIDVVEGSSWTQDLDYPLTPTNADNKLPKVHLIKIDVSEDHVILQTDFNLDAKYSIDPTYGPAAEMHGPTIHSQTKRSLADNSPLNIRVDYNENKSSTDGRIHQLSFEVSCAKK